jgi:DNA adenine methylase
VLLRKPRSYAEVYNDLDGEIVSVFRCFQSPDAFRALKRRLVNTPFARSEHDLSYEATPDPIEAVARTIVRSWFGFGNSAQRTSGKSGFQAMTEMTGSSKSMQWKSYLTRLDEFRDRLMGVVIENRDAGEVIAHQDTEGTLFYVDPPYVSETRKSGTYKFEMTTEDHAALCERLSQVKGMVILSGYDNPVYNALGWHREEIDTQSMASINRERKEIIWLNPAAVRARPQPSLFSEAL